MRRLALLACVALAALALPGVAAAKKAPNDFFGVVSQEALTGADYSHLAEGDVGTMRIAFTWASFQQVEGQCQAEAQVGICSWTVMDGIIGSAAQAGTRIIPILAGPPSFVSKNPKNPPIKGQDAKRWKAFLSAAAERYGRGGLYWKVYDDYGAKPFPITDWQVWNEQNSKQGWQGRPDAKKYAKLLKISSKAIKKKDKKANIVLGGMFGDSKVTLTSYMKQLYRVKHVERYFDTIALHPYAPQIGDLKRQLGKARSAARKGGDRKAKLRITELGWSSKKGKHPLMKGPSGQAKMLKKSFGLLKRKRGRWNLVGVNWFALQDTNNPTTCAFCRQTGLFQTNGNAKPAWGAFKKFSK